jgi:hypothetical protein
MHEMCKTKVVLKSVGRTTTGIKILGKKNFITVPCPEPDSYYCQKMFHFYTLLFSQCVQRKK